MKNLLLIISMALFLGSCNDQAKIKDQESLATTVDSSKDEIEINTIIDKYGDKMEVTKNLTKNTIIVKLDGKTYELSKNSEGPSYSTKDNKYSYTETKKEVSLTNKNIDMVLFHAVNNKQSSTIAAQ